MCVSSRVLECERASESASVRVLYFDTGRFRFDFGNMASEFLREDKVQDHNPADFETKQVWAAPLDLVTIIFWHYGGNMMWSDLRQTYSPPTNA